MMLRRTSLVLVALLCARGGVMGQEMGARDVSSAIVAALDYRLSEIPEGSLVLATDRIVIPDGMVRPAHADLAEIARARGIALGSYDDVVEHKDKGSWSKNIVLGAELLSVEDGLLRTVVSSDRWVGDTPHFLSRRSTAVELLLEREGSGWRVVKELFRSYGIGG